MKLLLYIFLLIQPGDGVNRIAEINAYKKAGNEAFKAEDYKEAVEKYRYLYDTLKVKEDPVILNLGHAYYHLKDTTNAKSFYGVLTASKNDGYRSIAYQQLGNISAEQKKYEVALNQFKNALRADPENDDARYNYELTKKLLDQQKQQQDKENKDKDQEPSEFAKRIKKQADEYVRNNQFVAAYNVMVQGLQQDQTVNAYKEFINKLKDVAEVETKK